MKGYSFFTKNAPLYRSAMVQRELYEAAKACIRSIPGNDTQFCIVLSTWPDITTTKVSWTYSRRGYQMRGMRNLALHKVDYSVYDSNSTPVRGPVPPLISGTERWSAAVRGLLREIDAERRAWSLMTHDSIARVHYSAIADGVRPYVRI